MAPYRLGPRVVPARSCPAQTQSAEMRMPETPSDVDMRISSSVSVMEISLSPGLYLRTLQPQTGYRRSDAGDRSYLGAHDRGDVYCSVLGQLDDLLIVPLGILLAARLMSPALRSEFRAAAEARLDRPRSRGGAIANVVLWIVHCVAAGFALWRNIGGA